MMKPFFSDKGLNKRNINLIEAILSPQNSDVDNAVFKINVHTECLGGVQVISDPIHEGIQDMLSIQLF